MLNSVNATALAKAGIRLQAPTKPALVSQDAALRAALRAVPGSTVRETLLADFSDTHHVPPISTLAWAVSLTGPAGFRPYPGGPARGRAVIRPSYLLVTWNQAGEMRRPDHQSSGD